MLPACTVPAGEQRICQPAQCQRGSNNAVSLHSASRGAEICQPAQRQQRSRDAASLHSASGGAVMLSACTVPAGEQ
jgi:hypothetical protein